MNWFKAIFKVGVDVLDVGALLIYIMALLFTVTTWLAHAISIGLFQEDAALMIAKLVFLYALATCWALLRMFGSNDRGRIEKLEKEIKELKEK